MARFDWSQPYASQRMPVNARNVVATSHPLAAQAGLQVLHDGGNAVDAAVATAACMTVLEPTSNGIGGDCFALVHDGEAVLGLNGSGRSPAALDAARIMACETYPRLGWDPVTVPGCVRGWVDLNQRLGRLTFSDCLKPAIRYAREGFLVSPLTAGFWARGAETFRGMDDWESTFLFDGKPPAPGQLITLPDHADTLESIAETGGRSFYEGELATAIAEAARADGGALNEDDLAGHCSLWVDPIRVAYRGVEIHEIPPNGQGIAALIALGILEHFDLPGMEPDTPEVLHLQIESMKLGFADAHRHVADPDCLDTTCEALLGPDRIAELADRLDPERAQRFDSGIPKPGGTILLTTADEEGRCVSLIQSNYAGFGSGVVIPGTGIAMQNRGACFSLAPGHPNVVAPSKRPYHTIIPGMMTPGPGGTESDLMTFGVMGGFMQPQGHLQLISRLRDFRQNPQAALDAPRWQWIQGLEVRVEAGFSSGVIDGLRDLGHQVSLAGGVMDQFGRGQAIHRLDEGWSGASDPRADGQAVGF